MGFGVVWLKSWLQTINVHFVIACSVTGYVDGRGCHPRYGHRGVHERRKWSVLGELTPSSKGKMGTWPMMMAGWWFQIVFIFHNIWNMME